jgi:hypothetical protein
MLPCNDAIVNTWVLGRQIQINKILQKKYKCFYSIPDIPYKERLISWNSAADTHVNIQDTSQGYSSFLDNSLLRSNESW